MTQDDKIQLLPASTRGSFSLEEVIAKRRSRRKFKQTPLTQAQISQLLWAAQGLTLSEGAQQLRAVPSAGALYPLELYMACAEGVFHYLPDEHALCKLGSIDVREALSEASYGQGCVSQAPLVIIIGAVYLRVTQKYGERGRRYTDMEAGHTAQNLHLQAVALSLDSVPVGAFNDAAVKKILQLPQGHDPLYIIPVGYAG